VRAPILCANLRCSRDCRQAATNSHKIVSGVTGAGGQERPANRSPRISATQEADRYALWWRFVEVESARAWTLRYLHHLASLDLAISPLYCFATVVTPCVRGSRDLHLHVAVICRGTRIEKNDDSTSTKVPNMLLDAYFFFCLGSTRFVRVLLRHQSS
jgi:hypothetical protein